LLAHKVALELTLSTQHKEYGLNPQISQREGWGEPLRLRACKNWLGTSAKSLETATLTRRRLGVFIPPQRIKLAVAPRAAPVRLVPHTDQTGV
jgi:hypothetical protein